MKPVDDPAALAGKLDGTGSLIAVTNTGQTSLLALVYKLKGATDSSGRQALRRRRTNTSPPGRC